MSVAGFRIGHATHRRYATGCTVVLCAEGSLGGVDVRGPAPGSRETPLLAPDKHVARVDALLFTGGSAFGLAAADGVMRYLGDRGIGHPTPVRPIPIVPASVIYDLRATGGNAPPDAALGHAACVAAEREQPPTEGPVGAGAGAVVGKWAGFDAAMPGGVGYTERAAGQARVAALAVVNAVGDVVDERGAVLAGARAQDGTWLAAAIPERWREPTPTPATNTTLVALLTDAALSKVEANRLAQRAHDGLAQAISPAHTTHDGDTTYALASGRAHAPFELVANVGVACVAAAIRRAVQQRPAD